MVGITTLGSGEHKDLLVTQVYRDQKETPSSALLDLRGRREHRGSATMDVQVLQDLLGLQALQGLPLFQDLIEITTRSVSPAPPAPPALLEPRASQRGSRS